MESVRILFAERLRALRKSGNLTQKQVADILQLDRSTYAYYESAKTTPSYDTLLRITKVFDVSLLDLLGETADTSLWNLQDGQAVPSETSGYSGLWRDEKLFLGLFRQLNPEQVNALHEYLFKELQVSAPQEDS